MDRLNRRGARGGRRRGGFTLVEVMVALGILAAGLLTVAVAQLHAMRGGSSGRHLSEAATIAHSLIENLQRIDFSDGDLAATAGEWNDAGDEERIDVRYAVEYRVADVDPDLKAVDVRVTWDEPQRPGRRLILSTQIHDDPQTGG